MIKIQLEQSVIAKEERLSKALLLNVQKVLNQNLKDQPDGIMAVAFISDEEMHALNHRYRGKDKTTDVLSFSYLEDEDEDTLGDVVISVEQARLQAKNGLENELVTLIVHGVLHVLGFDHETKKDAKIMLPLQDKIVEHIL